MPATPNGPEDNQTYSHPQGAQACTYVDARSASYDWNVPTNILARGA